eukprot:452393-Pelagomonas_calceolata.AAC.1
MGVCVGMQSGTPNDEFDQTRLCAWSQSCPSSGWHDLESLSGVCLSPGGEQLRLVSVHVEGFGQATSTASTHFPAFTSWEAELYTPVGKEADLDARIRAFKTSDPAGMGRLSMDQLAAVLEECRCDIVLSKKRHGLLAHGPAGGCAGVQSGMGCLPIGQLVAVLERAVVTHSFHAFPPARKSGGKSLACGPTSGAVRKPWCHAFWGSSKPLGAFAARVWWNQQVAVPGECRLKASARKE